MSDVLKMYVEEILAGNKDHVTEFAQACKRICYAKVYAGNFLKKG